MGDPRGWRWPVSVAANTAINIVLIPLASIVWLFSGRKTVPEGTARAA